jgi:vancomycin resistance protein VanW
MPKMGKKRVTQIFPFLLPLRLAQRKAFFYAGMRFDGRAYAGTQQEEALPYRLFAARNGLYNTDTGFDMVYQANKVFNLKIAAKALDGLLLKPGETFSFWRAVRYADKYEPYKEGLTVTNGRLGVAVGGGLCQMSNLLFWVFLHSPLSVVERHTHDVKDFPTMRDAEPEGVDATISEGWRDLKVKNETDITFQIRLSFDDANIAGSLYTDKIPPFSYEIEGKDLSYFRENGGVYQKISIYRREIDIATQKVRSENLLYTNLCAIGYQLPEGTEIGKKDEIDKAKLGGRAKLGRRAKLERRAG